MTENSPQPPAIRETLEAVTDPELDRSIVDLEYVDEISVDGDRVTVEFTLPTAWCSPAFAWMMAVDAREAVEKLASVSECTVSLREHLHEEEINRGVNRGLSFEEAFPDAEDGIDALREKLDEKARLARQYTALETLREAGLGSAAIVDLRLEDLAPTGEDVLAVHPPDRAVAVIVPATPLERYLEKARETGVVTDPDDVLFRTPAGEPINHEHFDLVYRRCRAARVNISGQAGICQGLHESRQERLEEATND